MALFAEPRDAILEEQLPHSTPEALALIPRALATRHSILAIRRDADELFVVVPRPIDESAVERVRAVTGLRLSVRESSREALRSCIAERYADIDTPSDEVCDDAPAIRAVDRLHDRALRMRASDIHLEPTQTGGRIRMRVDGILHESERVPRELFAPMISRLKVLAAMDIAERRQPQDGRYPLERLERSLDARVSSMPTIAGEKLVIRLLDMQAELPSLGRLGMPSSMLDRYRRAIHAPHGFIVVCGPTGSGKTTTLYASLAERDLESQHVCTVEDPVEVQMSGVAQVQVNPRAGVTFASALRALLRQDPNVIMLGEMRDSESAGVAMSAALSGQLVLTTLHANDAPRAIERLVELGLNRQTLAAGLTAIVSQRLVRRLCTACRRVCDSPLGMLYEPVGCAQCEGAGYRGRIGLFEFLPMSHAIRSAIARGEGALELARLARAGGYEPMMSEGLRRAQRGETSGTELQRVLGFGEDV